MNNQDQKEFERYEKEHNRNLAALAAALTVIYTKYLRTIFFRLPALIGKPDPEKLFNIDQHPVAKKFVYENVDRLIAEIEDLTFLKVKGSWTLANEKTDGWITRLLKGRELPGKWDAVFFAHNESALQAFLNQKRGGLKLSERVWNIKPHILAEIETGLQTMIQEGKPATQMATEMKQYLKNPDKLFRRIRDAQGNLQLSKAAKDYHPGRGVYRSSHKNALRLTRSEVNMAYRTADQERWKRMDFVLGYEVKLSAQHKIFDICDHAAGRYPKSFLFRAWHSQCRCYCIPIRASDETFENYLNYVLENDQDPADFKFTGHVQGIPKGLSQWVTDNRDRINGWKIKPYFIADNIPFFKKKG